MKKCKKCGDPKEDSEFIKGRNQCKLCYNEVQRQWALNNPEKVKLKAAKTYKKRTQNDTKVCKCCGNEKKKSLFHLSSKTCNKCKENPKVVIPKITENVFSMVQPKQKKFVSKDPKEIMVSKKIVTNQINYGRSIKVVHRDHEMRMAQIKQKVAERYGL